MYGFILIIIGFSIATLSIYHDHGRSGNQEKRYLSVRGWILLTMATIAMVVGVLQQASEIKSGTEAIRWRNETSKDLEKISSSIIEVSSSTSDPIIVKKLERITKNISDIVSPRPLVNQIIEPENLKVKLHSVRIYGDELTIEFTNWSSGCVELITEDGLILGNRNVFCDSGNNVKISKYDHIITPGMKVRLCRRTNNRELQCTPPVMVFGEERKIEVEYIKINNGILTVKHRENFSTSLHFRGERFEDLNTKRSVSGSTGEWVIQEFILGDLNLTEAGKKAFQVGQRVQLVHGNNSSVRSQLVTITN